MHVLDALHALVLAMPMHRLVFGLDAVDTGYVSHSGLIAQGGAEEEGEAALLDRIERRRRLEREAALLDDLVRDLAGRTSAVDADLLEHRGVHEVNTRSTSRRLPYRNVRAVRRCG